MEEGERVSFSCFCSEGRSTMLNLFMFSDLVFLGYGATAGATSGQGGKPQGKTYNTGLFQLSRNT